MWAWCPISHGRYSSLSWLPSSSASRLQRFPITPLACSRGEDLRESVAQRVCAASAERAHTPAIRAALCRQRFSHLEARGSRIPMPRDRPCAATDLGRCIALQAKCLRLYRSCVAWTLEAPWIQLRYPSVLSPIPLPLFVPRLAASRQSLTSRRACAVESPRRPT